MGFIAQPTPEMGEYSVEVRRESFYLYGEDNWDTDSNSYIRRRHTLTLYEKGDSGQGTVEILIEDIPKIRAALDQAERIAGGNKLPTD